jgi:arylsulfatase A-like enzyme
VFYKKIYLNWVIGLVFGPILFGCDKSQEERPNIILIMSDDQGWGDLSLNGNVNLQTPHIDQLARSGVRFSHFYVSPVCSPTRAELLTGRYHPRSGVFSTSEGGERIDLDETTMADIFKKAGYATAAFGKWHNGTQYPYHPNARGFDEFYGFCSGHWGNYFDPPLEHNGKPVKGEGYIVDDLTNKALAFMDKIQERPFFLYIPYNTPHSPMQVPDKWWDKLKDKNLEMLAKDPEMEEPAFTKAALAMCENIDWNLGRILNKLKELDLEDETIVLYLSDNGPNSWRWNGGMKGRKGSTDEGGVRSPLIIRWPGNLPAGMLVEKIAGTIDLLPTLAELAGINYRTSKPLDGISLRPLLLNKDEPWEDRFIFAHWGDQTSVRNQQFRLDHLGKLYNIPDDPSQEVDLSLSNPHMTSSMSNALQEWKSEVLGELSKEPRPFPIGHADFKYTHLPARDGIGHGNIQRSNRFPNDTFFTNWTHTEDKITWNVEVLTEGEYSIEVYYTCPPKDVGATFQLSFGSNSLEARVKEAITLLYRAWKMTGQNVWNPMLRISSHYTWGP